MAPEQDSRKLGLLPTHNVMIVAFTVLVAFGTLYPYSPTRQTIPGGDSGVFLYIGKSILDGKIPYRDVWDHKPPVIHYLNALGLFLTGSRWGVYLLEVAHLSVASLFFFLMIRRAFGGIAAIVGLISFALNLNIVLEGGNLTEEYALAYQVMALWLFVVQGDRIVGRPLWPSFVIGILLGVTFWLRQNLVGIGIAILAWWVIAGVWKRVFKSAILHVGSIALGTLIPCLVIVSYFYSQGALESLWDAAFRYNFSYSSVTFADRLNTLQTSMSKVSGATAILSIALIAWAMSCYVLISNKWQVPSQKQVAATRISLIALGLILTIFGLWSDQLFGGEPGLGKLQILMVVVGTLLFMGGAILKISESQEVTRSQIDAQMRFLQSSKETISLISLSVLLLPAEMGMLSVSGRGFLHYYIPVMIPLAILIALPVFMGLPAVNMAHTHREKQREQYIAWAFSCALAANWLPSQYWLSGVFASPIVDEDRTRIVTLIQEKTEPNDLVLILGSETALLFAAQRNSPTKYVYQYPVADKNYGGNGLQGEFYRSVNNAKPRLIINTHELSLSMCFESDCPNGIDMSGYRLIGQLGNRAWDIYMRIDNEVDTQ